MSPKNKSRLRTLIAICVLVGAVVVLWVGVNTLLATNGSQQPFVFYTVTKTDLPIVVTERGSLESQVKTTISNKVENVTVDRSGSAGTQILMIVPNGSAVEEGQLIVELDSATIRDRLDTQTLAVQKAVSAKTQAIAKYDNQLIQNQTAFEEAVLQIELAKLQLKMYTDPTNGTFQLAKEDIERQIDSAKNATLESRAALELAKVDRSGMKELFRLGYRGKSDLDQSLLKFLQAEDRLASAVNQMKTYQGAKRKLTEYERKMEELTLEGAVQTAVRALEQVKNDNKSLEEQALAAKDEAVKTALKEEERLERLANQLENCKIYAPHGGMIVYHQERRGGSEIMEGTMLRERQTIMSIPNLALMQVKTQVHEAVLDQIRSGLPATIKVDAFPNQTFPAVVERVGVVPSSDGGWMSSGSVKTYDTIVKLLGEVSSLKPGMTAVVNIHVDNVEDVIAVPVQSVMQIERDNWCYVDTDHGVEKRPVKIGRSNDKFVHIREGLVEGERVVLNPMDIFEDQSDGENEISPETGVPEISDELKQAVADDAAENAESIETENPRGPGKDGPEKDGPGRNGGVPRFDRQRGSQESSGEGVSRGPGGGGPSGERSGRPRRPRGGETPAN